MTTLLAHMLCHHPERPSVACQESMLPEPNSTESDPVVCVDVPGALVHADRCAAVFQQRALACWACTLLLACISTRALLHWPHQMKTFQETRSDLVLLSDSNSADYASWTTIRWAKHPTKCLDVAGDHSGAQLQIWHCSDDFPKKQRFIVPPPGSTGEIKWATNPELCLDNPFEERLQLWYCAGAADEHRLWNVFPKGNSHIVLARLQLWYCAGAADEHRLFSMFPDGGNGRIVLAAQPNRCVDIPTGVEDDGWKVQLWDCDDATMRGREDNVAFTITTAIDCTWGSWSPWSACPVTCGGGSHVRTRTVEAKSTGGGKACKDSDHLEMGSCGSQMCEQQHTLTTSTTLKPSFKHLEMGSCGSQMCEQQHTLTTSTTLKPSFKYATTHRSSAQRHETGKARLYIFVLASLPLAMVSQSTAG
eukprot:CAMPEP_0172930884 /NCGR_PEP_ID=MMETSP1075-20121228/219216_1 /TAXON_ID=2916 /ORGANISM="Ceratium fusus, Strain PA161109" /LENGTH=419 /DNA_ID=CAMNT_0013792197 /DNA_START=49 /DNA_END=1308 /DNA_ORIENTATION=+